MAATEVARKEKGAALAPWYQEFPFYLSRMRDEFDRMFERMSLNWPAFKVFGNGNWRWDLNVTEEDNQVVVRAEAPGFEAGDFDIQVRGNQLILKAARKFEKEEKEKHYREWEKRECYEAVTLPPGIDPEKVNARYDNGVLTVTFPKTEEGKAKRIPVKNA